MTPAQKDKLDRFVDQCIEREKAKMQTQIAVQRFGEALRGARDIPKVAE